MLVSAAACGWVLGSAATAALTAREMPLPAPRQESRLPCVVVDRTASQAPLAKGPDNDDRGGRGFGLLEQAIPRLGYATVRAEGDDVFRGDAVLMICPSRPIDEGFRRRLIEYVDGGGRLLVIDAGLSDVPSTSNQILRPFGLSLDYTQPWNGELTRPAREADAGDSVPRVEEAQFPAGIFVESAWQVLGGTGLAAVHAKLERLHATDAEAYTDATTCAAARYGGGLVMVCSFGNMFNDKGLGNDAWHDPDRAERARYDVLFALLRRLVQDEAMVLPARGAKAAEPKITVPLNRPPRRDTPPKRRSGT